MNSKYIFHKGRSRKIFTFDLYIACPDMCIVLSVLSKALSNLHPNPSSQSLNVFFMNDPFFIKLQKTTLTLTFRNNLYKNSVQSVAFVPEFFCEYKMYEQRTHFNDIKICHEQISTVFQDVRCKIGAFHILMNFLSNLKCATK